MEFLVNDSGWVVLPNTEVCISSTVAKGPVLLVMHGEECYEVPVKQLLENWNMYYTDEEKVEEQDKLIRVVETI